MSVEAPRGACTACGVVLGSRGMAWRCSQVVESGSSGGLAQSFMVCAWCVDQMRIRGAVERANARKKHMPNLEQERYRRAKLRMPAWMERRITEGAEIRRQREQRR